MRWRIGLCIFLPLLLFIAIVESLEYYHNWEVRNAPEVQGQVIKRETISSLNGFRNTGRMTVRIVDSNVEVIAATNSVRFERAARDGALSIRWRPFSRGIYRR
jgi:hypothetical protein